MAAVAHSFSRPSETHECKGDHSVTRPSSSSVVTRHTRTARVQQFVGILNATGGAVCVDEVLPGLDGVMVLAAEKPVEVTQQRFEDRDCITDPPVGLVGDGKVVFGPQCFTMFSAEVALALNHEWLEDGNRLFDSGGISIGSGEVMASS